MTVREVDTPPSLEYEFLPDDGRIKFLSMEEQIQASIEARQDYQKIKRLLDIFFAFAALIVLSPILLLVALIVFLDDPRGGSPIYVSDRCGKDGRIFRFYKFRTMCRNAETQLVGLLDQNEADGPAFKIKNDPRVTKLGRFLRKVSIDELPQLLNIIKGDMSIVGPRPPIPREVEQYTPYQRLRLSIKPGLTCYWQVQPRRNDISFEDWIWLDLTYISELSLKTDAKIVLRTVCVMFSAEGV